MTEGRRLYRQNHLRGSSRHGRGFLNEKCDSLSHAYGFAAALSFDRDAGDDVIASRMWFKPQEFRSGSDT